MTHTQSIVTVAARLFGVTEADITGQSRVVRIVEARQALAWTLREEHWSLESIGLLLGGRDHTTIIYSIERASRKKTQNTRFAERLAVLAEAVRPDQAYPLADCGCSCAARLAELESRLARLEATIQ